MAKNLRTGLRQSIKASSKAGVTGGGIFSLAPLDLRFALQKTLDPRVTFTRASTGTYVGSDGLIKSATTNEARFDHNPTTGESLGLLVEEPRTNSIRNNTGVGTVAGTPGTLPTNWSGATTVDGLTREIIGTGTQNGISYIDVRFSGTSGTGGSTVLVTFDSLTQAAASTGQTWTPSIYLSIANGSTINISTLTIRHRYYNAVGTALTSSDTSILTSLSSVLQRFNGTAFTAADALTAYTMFLLNVDFVNSSPVDITLRIGLPQLEQGAFATSVIPTTTATATRAADVASVTGANFSSWYNQTEGTVFANYAERAFSVTHQVATVSNGTANERISLAINSSNTLDVGVISGGTDTFGGNTPTLTAQEYWIGFGYRADNSGVSVNGSAITVDSAVTLPTVSQLDVGARAGSSQILNSTIKRLIYWPVRLGNNVLQQITQP